MPSELLPCPFCGGRAILCADFIWCRSCKLRLQGFCHSECIAAWNTRAPDPQLSALQWTPIDAEHLPKVGDEVLMRFQSALYVREVLSVCGLGKGWTHFRPINAPEKL